MGKITITVNGKEFNNSQPEHGKKTTYTLV